MLSNLLDKIPLELITLIGVVIATILSGIGYVTKIWLDNKSVLKECLFNLLKAYKALTLIEDLEIEQRLLKRMKKEFPEMELSEKEEIQLKNYLKQLLNSSISPSRDRYLKELSENYNSVIIKLARIKPILAYDLSKQFYANQYIKDFGDQLDTLNEWEEMPSSNFIKKTSQEPILKDARQELKNYILKVAFRASKLRWAKLKFFSDIFEKNEVKLPEELDEYFFKIKEHFKDLEEASNS